MEIVKAQQSFRGPMIAVITHLNDDLSIDHGAIRANINYVIEHGFGYGHGALPDGGAGSDFPTLSLVERKTVAQTIVEAADGRVPVLIGAQDTNVETVVEMARWAKEIGADGIQLSPGWKQGITAARSRRSPPPTGRGLIFGRRCGTAPVARVPSSKRRSNYVAAPVGQPGFLPAA